MKKIFCLLFIMLASTAAVHADDGGKAFLEKFYRGGTECSFDNSYVKMSLTSNAVKFLRDSYDYDGEGMAVWLFYKEAGWDIGDFREYLVRKVKENTYRVVIRSNFNEDVYEYSVLFGLVRVGNTWAIDTMKPESGHLVSPEQGIKDGSRWNIGSLDYVAHVDDVNTVTFRAMSEGEELSFRLKANPDKENEYVLGDNPYADGYNPFSHISRVRFINNDGYRLLCLYDQKGELQAVLNGKTYTEGEKVAQTMWDTEIQGYYIDKYGDTLQISHGTVYDKGVARATYEHLPFNGTVTGVIRVSGLTNLEGLWEVVVTLDGLTLYEVEQDEYGMFQRKGGKEQLSWARKDFPRFNFARVMILNDGLLRKLKKSTLRIMRNEILAGHGYRFQSKDLQDYFSQRTWYRPAASNNEAEQPNLLEMLNIELIKAEEGRADEDRNVLER